MKNTMAPAQIRKNVSTLALRSSPDAWALAMPCEYESE
jgi:hypothetical protein